MISIKVEVFSSIKIEQAVSEALLLSIKLNTNVSFDFCGIPVLVTPFSEVSKVVEWYWYRFERIEKAAP